VSRALASDVESNCQGGERRRGQDYDKTKQKEGQGDSTRYTSLSPKAREKDRGKRIRSLIKIEGVVREGGTRKHFRKSSDYSLGNGALSGQEPQGKVTGSEPIISAERRKAEGAVTKEY